MRKCITASYRRGIRRIVVRVSTFSLKSSRGVGPINSRVSLEFRWFQRFNLSAASTCVLLLVVEHVLSGVMLLSIIAKSRCLLKVEGLSMHVLVMTRVLAVVVGVVGVVLMAVSVSEGAE